MKLPSRLFKSRHGVFYYRFQFQHLSGRKERRVSLHTKSPAVAKAKAIQISAIILRNNFSVAEMASSFNPDDPSTWPSVLGNSDSHRKLDVELPNGFAFRNINTSEDVHRTLEIMKALNISSPEEMAKFIAGPNPQKIAQPASQYVNPTANPPEQTGGGATLDEIIQRYATRKGSKLASKTLYEYGNYHRKFSEWIALRKKNKHYPFRLITRADVGDYIDDLKSKNISDNCSSNGSSSICGSRLSSASRKTRSKHRSGSPSPFMSSSPFSRNA